MSENEETTTEGNSTLTHNTDEIVVLMAVITGCLIGAGSFAAYLITGVELDFEQLIAVLGIFVLTPMSYVYGKKTSA